MMSNVNVIFVGCTINTPFPPLFGFARVFFSEIQFLPAPAVEPLISNSTKVHLILLLLFPPVSLTLKFSADVVLQGTLAVFGCL